jgi:Protein of unknown function (DUF2490)
MIVRLGRWCTSPALLFFFAAVVSGQSILPSQSDTQSWNDVTFSVALNKAFDFGVLGTLRVGRDVSRPVDERIGAAFSYKAGKYLTFIPAYLHIDMQPFKGRKLYENRLGFATTVRFPVGHFIVTDRNLFERRLRHPGGDSTRYRNRLQIEHPVGPPKMKFSLFVADEVFYDWSFNAWVRNRFTIGVSKVLNKHMTLDLYYLRQNDGHSVPGDIHVIGTNWRFKF